MRAITYQPEIDGLRAIAVMSVVLFHAQIPLFDGGFVGVDVFFVISGYLITRLLIKDVEKGSFSFSQFYLRRTRRLFPALFVTVALTFIIGALLLTPYHMEGLGGSAITSLFWTSNIYFWLQSGYFDADAYTKPLLHTWSLSVEEQFYLMWPAMILLVLRSEKLRHNLPHILLTLSVISLAWAEYLLVRNPSASFYLPLSRIYEFGIGAILVFVVKVKKKSSRLDDVLLVSGILLIAVSVVSFSERTEFQGRAALWPCLGTAMAIYAGQGFKLGFLLTNPIAVRIGLVSYSLYLVHWPVIVFLNYRLLEFNRPHRVFAVLLSLFLATLLFKYVETPLRYRTGVAHTSTRRYIMTCLALSSFVAVPAYSAWSQLGWQWRWDVSRSVLEMISDRESTLR